jgi:hypothetical protein
MAGALAACGSASGTTSTVHLSSPVDSTSSSSSASTPSSASTTTTGSKLDQGDVVPAPSSSTTVPHERGVRPIDPTVDNGQQILITGSGFVPAQLFADVTEPVVWTNLSGVTQRITFDVFPVVSPPIPPGAQFVWQPSTTLDIGYHSAAGKRGALILQPHTRD